LRPSLLLIRHIPLRCSFVDFFLNTPLI
jgi:hypothetical protein